jgi:hypothetical protein
MTQARAQPATRLPNLVVIGAQKCGTTSLHHYLAVHPEVSMSAIKETNFFLGGDAWDRGTSWYASLVDPAAKIRGESSPEYTNLPVWQGVAERMHTTIPDAKLIYLVRDPIERIISHYVHRVATGEERRKFDEAVRGPDNVYVTRSRYAVQIRPFLERYPRERILIASQEELLTRRRASLRRIFGFLDVDEEFVSPAFERLWERTEGKRVAYLAAFRVAQRGVRLPKPLRWPAQRLLRSPLGGPSFVRPEPSPAVRAELTRYLQPDMEEFRRMAGLAADDRKAVPEFLWQG